MSSFRNRFNNVIISSRTGLGLDYQEAAEFFGVVNQTIERWALYNVEPVNTVWTVVFAIEAILRDCSDEQKEKLRKWVKESPAIKLEELIKFGLDFVRND